MVCSCQLCGLLLDVEVWRSPLVGWQSKCFEHFICRAALGLSLPFPCCRLSSWWTTDRVLGWLPDVSTGHTSSCFSASITNSATQLKGQSEGLKQEFALLSQQRKVLKMTNFKNHSSSAHTASMHNCELKEHENKPCAQLTMHLE